MKMNKYLNNYARRNILSVVEARAHNFMKENKIFIKATPVDINKFLDHVTNVPNRT